MIIFSLTDNKFIYLPVNYPSDLRLAKMLLGIEDVVFEARDEEKKLRELYTSDECQTSLKQLYDSTSDDLNLSCLICEEADNLEDDKREKEDTSDQNIVDDDFFIVQFPKRDWLSTL